MKTATYDLLCRLHDHYRPRAFGKLAQKLLAISYRLAGFRHVVERGVQGVDVDAANGSQERYATEVRTTVSLWVPFHQKDADGLASRGQDGYQPRLAVLQLRPLSEWRLLRVERLRVGRLLIESLHPYRDRELERRLQPCFDETVEAHFDGSLAGGQSYLDRILRELGAEVRPV
jgi:hypothetical protein